MSKPWNPPPGTLEARAMLEQANRHLSLGQVPQAESLLTQVLKENPREIQALLGLGMIAAQTHRPESAIDRMNQALALDPNCTPALGWLSHFYLQSNQIAQARKCAEKAASLEPNNVAAQMALARCFVQEGDYRSAIPFYQKALTVQPNNAGALYELADAFMGARKEREATETLRKAVHLAPNPTGLLRLSYVELRFGRIDDAERYCKQLLLIQPDHPTAHVIMGRILTERLKPEEAEFHWKKARDLDPQSDLISLERALSLTAIGEFDLAVSALKQSIATNPNQGQAYQALFFAKRVTEEELPLVKQMENLLSKPLKSENDRLSLLYSLGKAYDNFGEYERAMGYFDQANALKRKISGAAPFDREACKSLVDAKIRLFDKHLLERSKAGGIDSDLPILIVGMMRSGTTLAEQMLTCHPLVGGAGEQHLWGDLELPLVDYGRQVIDTLGLKRAAKEYLKFLESMAPGYPHVIDKNPANIQVLGSFAIAFPNARIIHTRRNAIDTALSIWMTPMNTTASFIADRDDIVFAYKQFMRLMDHWLKVLPSDRFMEMQYDELVGDPETNGRKMAEFCGLEWTDACLHPESNKRRVLTPSLWQVRQPIYKTSTERWRKYEPWLGIFSELKGLS